MSTSLHVTVASCTARRRRRPAVTVRVTTRRAEIVAAAAAACSRHEDDARPGPGASPAPAALTAAPAGGPSTAGRLAPGAGPDDVALEGSGRPCRPVNARGPRSEGRTVICTFAGTPRRRGPPRPARPSGGYARARPAARPARRSRGGTHGLGSPRAAGRSTERAGYAKCRSLVAGGRQGAPRGVGGRRCRHAPDLPTRGRHGVPDAFTRGASTPRTQEDPCPQPSPAHRRGPLGDDDAGESCLLHADRGPVPRSSGDTDRTCLDDASTTQPLS